MLTRSNFVEEHGLGVGHHRPAQVEELLLAAGEVAGELVGEVIDLQEGEHLLDPVEVPCEACGGKRYKDEVLEYKLGGKSIADVLDMTVRQALEHFDQPKIQRTLQMMSDVGLHYLTLGQPLPTLSGGECQRIKLASELHKEGSIYVIDEPTTGLHKADTAQLLEILNKLVEGGNTVIVIEHNMDVVRNADWVIDLGPEGGSRGGQVMFEGTPLELKEAEQSRTSQYI